MRQRLTFEWRYLVDRTPWDSGITPPEVERYLQDHVPGRAPELGCGTGTNAVRLAEAGWQVTAVDISTLAILSARRKAARANRAVTLMRADVGRAQDLREIRGPFDLALDIGCLHALRPAQRVGYAGRLQRWLSPGADYLLYAFLQPSEQPSRWPSPAELEALFTNGFHQISIEHGEFDSQPSAWFQYERTP
jgi:cyclopropane fatty-acyl-phospholipid synthase-like methyltransferase